MGSSISAGYPVFSATIASSVSCTAAHAVAWLLPGLLRGNLGLGTPRGEEIDDVGERLEDAEVLGLDDGGVGELFLKRGEDLDAFDRVDTEVGVEPHRGLEHLGGIAGLLRHDRREHAWFLHGGSAAPPAGGPGLLRGNRRPRQPPRREEFDDLAERLEDAEVLGLDDGGVGELFLERGEDLDAFDRVDAEVGVEPHRGLEHLGGIPGLLRHDRREHRLDTCGFGLRLWRRG